MNKKITLLILFSVLFSVWFNSRTRAQCTGCTEILGEHTKSVIADSSTIVVPDNYSTIQEAIDKASKGDTIFVRAGTYPEHVVVDKSLSLSGENKHDTTIDGGGNGIVIRLTASNITFSGFTIQNGELGILFWYSSHNIFAGNTISSNSYGIYLQYSYYNILSGNAAINNSRNGIYMEGSTYNALTGNTISSGNDYGIYLYHSDNNVLSGNAFSGNDDGIRFRDSDNNVLSGNTFADNRHGILLYCSGNTTLLHNNFVDNFEPSRSIDSVNSWDDGTEGNYWSDYGDTDANSDGIGDLPYLIDENNQDGHPLMAMFLQFNVSIENQCYVIDVVSNSTISNLKCHSDLDNRNNLLRFRVEGAGFCRISVPNALIVPPLSVRVDGNPPLYFKEVWANGTRTWLYFTFDYPEHEVTITHVIHHEQLLWSQWAILGLTILIAIQLLISIRYYRLFKKQKKVIEAYERELGIFPVSHEERARMHFVKDVISREEKIEKFKKKYGITVQPARTLEDLMEKLGIQKES